MIGGHVRATFPPVNTPLASGPASSPPPPPASNGEQPPPPPAGDDAPPPRTAEDLAAEAEAQAADDAAAAANGEPPPRRSLAARIPELTQERDAAMDYANYWREQALKVLQPPAPGAAPPASTPGASQVPPPTRPAPLLKDFPTGDGNFDALKWSEKLAEWNTEQIDARVAHREQVREQATAAQTVQQTYLTKLATFRTTVPDFDIVAQNPKLPVSETMVNAIMASELGPQVYYHIAKNPAEAARIFRLAPDRQREAIAKLEGKLEAMAPPPPPPIRPGQTPPPGTAPPPGGKPPASTAPPPRQNSRAPDPPNPTRAGGAADVNLANCSLEEYLAQRLPHISAGGPRK